MTTTDIVQPIRGCFRRLFEALLNPVRCDRAVLLLLAGYAVVWTIYAEIVRSSRDLNSDMTELIAWSRDLSLGYLKHPPLAAWMVRLWFSLLPLTDLSFYLLAVLMPTIALWIVWRLSADYLALDKRVLGLALLTLVPFYNFHALKFNANTVLLPTWAVTTLWFLRSYRTRTTGYSVLAGIGAAACLLGKYWSIFLIAGLALAAAMDSRRFIYFRSAAPWITALTAVALLAPHLLWLYQHNFVPLDYAFAHHGANSFGAIAGTALSYLAGSTGYVVAPIILAVAAARPDFKTIAEMMWPSDRERRLVAVAFWGPLLLPIAGALTERTNLTSLWSMPAWTLLPILLLSPPTVKVRPLDIRRVLSLAIALPIVMVLAAPAIAVVSYYAGLSPFEGHARLLAAATERAWHQVTDQPLRFVGCNAATGVIAYAQDQPHALPARSFNGDIGDELYADAYKWPRPQGESAAIDAQLTKSGMALVCVADQPDWVNAAATRAAQNPSSRRIDVDIARRFLGIPGRLRHYVIFIIPPRQ